MKTGTRDHIARRELRWVASAQVIDATGPVSFAFAIGDSDGLPAIQFGVIA